MMITMLHHVPKPEKVIEEACRVTKKYVVVVEDLFHHELGKIWTLLRDQIFNLEFIGHPCQFRKDEEWRDLFKKYQLSVVHFEKVYTKLFGLRILNGLYILEK